VPVGLAVLIRFPSRAQPYQGFSEMEDGVVGRARAICTMVAGMVEVLGYEVALARDG